MVTAPTPWQGGLVAISSFGFGGSNVHAIVAGCVRPKGPPPRALPAPAPVDNPEALEGGETLIEEVANAPPLFPSEVRAQRPPVFSPMCQSTRCLVRMQKTAGKQHHRWCPGAETALGAELGRAALAACLSRVGALSCRADDHPRRGAHPGGRSGTAGRHQVPRVPVRDHRRAAQEVRFMFTS